LAAKENAARVEMDRVVALERAKQRLDEAEEAYKRLEKEIAERGLARTDLVRLEERLRRLERDQAIERDRDRGKITELEAFLRNPKNRDSEGFAREIKELDEVYKKHEDERTEQLIQARQKLVQCDEDMQTMDFRRDAAKARVQAEMENVQRLEHGVPPADVQPATLRSLERKIDVLLREMAELRRAVERQQGKDKTP